MKTSEEVIADIDRLLASKYGPGATDLGLVCRSALLANRKFLKKFGFPVSFQDKAYLNFYSTFVQDANYDGLDISNPGHLNDLYQINCNMFFGGRGTEELTPGELERFSRFMTSALGPRYYPPSRWPRWFFIATFIVVLMCSLFFIFRFC